MTENVSLLDSILRWLRAGYPHGVPSEDYVALFAILHRRLTETEVEEIVAQLTAGDPEQIDDAAIEAAIVKLAHEQPGDDDVARVASKLAAGGWPLAHPAQL
ncbi:DUF3349 domain-containing protein [Nocardia sp. alder85J]|uniref:DUF3349 domain-containing protein n=1 Tax=Nocardia sp. alder85J TaxID=2862949 RepID=UPI001CD4C829|nr:DUF3349 domain-containing protein [Nocardia sp. alder85J]MCX4092659.1 DUF3349 domain-containing protein [Nocardia sp. alder85J]